MAIKINLSLKESEKEYTFSDFNFDVKQDRKFGSNTSKGSHLNNDIVIDYDINAIGNEIVNLLNSKKYTRFLNPNFGLNLEKYLAEPLNAFTADFIKKEIYNYLIKSSGRFQVTQFDAYANLDAYTYQFSITIAIPILNFSDNFRIILEPSGKFSFTK